MNILSTIFGSAGKGIIEGVGSTLDKVISNPEEKLQAQKELTGVIMNGLNRLQEAQSEVLKAELTGSKLQRNWRPVVMLTFTFIVVYSYFIEPVMGHWLEMPNYELPAYFWELLKIGLGGYVIGRSAEKVAETMAGGGVNLFKRKKDRA